MAKNIYNVLETSVDGDRKMLTKFEIQPLDGMVIRYKSSQGLQQFGINCNQSAQNRASIYVHVDVGIETFCIFCITCQPWHKQ